MKSKPISPILTMSYYEGIIGPALSTSFLTITSCQWEADQKNIPYSHLSITQWEGEEIIAQMSLSEAIDSNLTLYIE